MKYYHKLLLLGLTLVLVWTVSIFFFYNRIVQAEKDNIYRSALKEAEVAFEKDLTYRRWVAGLGGLYAEVSSKLQPNDYLQVPQRDVITTDGEAMTMINPAYMMRMVYGMMNEEAGLQGHITSLTPLRPGNEPSEWEAKVLKSFKNNPADFHALATENEKPVLHFMRPMMTEEKCLKCHAQQGYKVGAIRGGISVTVPMSGYQQTMKAFIAETNNSFITIWIAGILSIIIVFNTLSRYERARCRAEDELAKTKNYLANIINSMPSILVGVDPEGRITHWNMEAEKKSHISSNDAIGLPLSQALPDMQNELDRILMAMKNRVIETDSVQTKTDTGITRYDDITIYPLIANGVEGAVIRIDDVTERMNLEQMMIQSEKMMSVGGLAAGMAHEINNPLAGILGHAQNIEKRLLSDMEKNKSAATECGISLVNLRQYMDKRQIPKMLSGIKESGNRAATIVSNMLSFSRKSDKINRRHRLDELLEKTIELVANDYNLKKHYDFRKIEIIRQYDENTPAVHCDGNEIQQVLLNLLKNGAEAMSEKDYGQDQPRFICRIKNEEDMAIVEIEDNGPGITIQPVNRIFDPFFTTKELGKGTGLGLSVSYFIISDQHNGIMEVNSIPGEWTRFTIKLPLK
ncbi:MULTISPECIES: c-type heme family protein [unclassified Maridesulfovibrio]|uniref:c-type heme family protein n=1 Tax=unclassified Maridesulfovibrio TaxID=2794999 RepID=UPI003B4126FF